MQEHLETLIEHSAKCCLFIGKFLLKNKKTISVALLPALLATAAVMPVIKAAHASLVGAWIKAMSDINKLEEPKTPSVPGAEEIAKVENALSSLKEELGL